MIEIIINNLAIIAYKIKLESELYKLLVLLILLSIYKC